MLSPGGVKSFVFARQASATRVFSARLAVQKQSFLFPQDSTWPPSDKGLLERSRQETWSMCTFVVLDTGKGDPVNIQFYFVSHSAEHGKHTLEFPSDILLCTLGTLVARQTEIFVLT